MIRIEMCRANSSASSVSQKSTLRFKMVAKAAIFGAGTLVSVSAPTSLALERAQRFGVRIIAVARRDQALYFEERKDETGGGLAA